MSGLSIELCGCCHCKAERRRRAAKAAMNEAWLKSVCEAKYSTPSPRESGGLSFDGFLATLAVAATLAGGLFVIGFAIWQAVT